MRSEQTTDPLRPIERRALERMNTPQEVIACTVCGGRSVTVKAWVDPNTDKVVAWFEGSADVWCDDCQEHNRLDVAPWAPKGTQ
mgnify:CR=1 FL=1